MDKFSKQIKGELKQENHTYINTVKDDQNKDVIEVEIGDIKQPEFIPQMKFKKWENEVNFSARLIDDQSGSQQVSSEENNTILWDKGNKSAHFYQTKVSRYQEYRDRNLGFLDKQKIKKIEYRENPWPHILIDGEIWARSDGLEDAIRKEKAAEAKGDVLIVGLGLGLINEDLKNNSAVTSITIIEISSEVVRLIRKLYPKRLKGVSIIEGDFYDFVQHTNQKFDYIYGDIFPNIDLSYFNAWERFVKESTPLLKEGGILDGRIKEAYGNDDPDNEAWVEEVYEFDITLKERPAKNSIEFTLQTKGLEFFYQPPLTEEEEKQGCYRPKDVIGSFAVYYKDCPPNIEGGKEYKTGKVMHLYRPRIQDAVGNWVYGDIHIDEQKEIMYVNIPQEFLDHAVYPIRHAAGLTFGFGSIGGTTSTNNGADTLRGSQFSGAAGTATAIDIYFASKTDGIGAKGALYTRSASTNTLLTNGGSNGHTTPAVTNNWVSLAFGTPPTITAITYDVIAGVDGVGKGASNTMKFDAGSAGQGSTASHGDTGVSFTYPTLPSSYTVTTTNTNKFSIFVTYTATGSGVVSTPFQTTNQFWGS